MNTVADFLGRRVGFWTMMVACIGMYAWSRYDVANATFAISVLAIIIPQFIMYTDRRAAHLATARDEALHAKVDTVIHGVADADDALIGIEQKIVVED